MLTLLLALAQAPTADAAPPAFATVVFRRQGYAELGDPGPNFPERAARMRQGGAATLDCAASDGGALDDCRVTAETPEGWGFAPAALRMAKTRFMTLAKPYPAQPRTPEGRVRVRVEFPRPKRAF